MPTNNRSAGESALTQPSVMLEDMQKTIKERIRWLLTKEGTPALVAIIVGFVLAAFVDGALGVVLATVAGLLVLKVFGKLHIPTKPWQELLMTVLPIVAKLCFLMIFFLPVADYLTLPTGHTPDTLMKYASILFVLPENLISGSPTDVFPGIPIVVLISIILMFWGSLNLDKKKNFNRALAGLLLYTLSPTIASVLSGDFRIRFLVEFFAVGYYLAWIGLALIPLHKFVLPKLLKTGSPTSTMSQGMNRFTSVAPVFMLTFCLTDLNAGLFQLSFDTFADYLAFETLHHLVAGLFGGVIAGLGAGAIVTQFSGTDAPPEIPEEPQGPQPSTDPKDVPGTTIEHNADGSVTKRLPDGTVATEYSDGTIYGELPDGTKATVYPDDTTKTVYPDGRVQVDNPDGSCAITDPDGSSVNIAPDGTTKTVHPDGRIQVDNPDGSSVITGPDGATANISPDGTMSTKLPEGDIVTVYPDGTVILTTTGPDGSTKNFDSEGKLIGRTLGSDSGEYAGFSVAFNPDRSFVLTSPYGGSVKVDANSNPIEGSITQEDGTVLIYKPDGTQQAIMPNGDKMTYNTDGTVDATSIDGSQAKLNSDGSMTAKFADNSAINIDAQGVGHFDMADGRRVTVNPDNTINVKSPTGDSATLNPDGSANFDGFDGEKMQVNSDGSGTVSTADGTTWKQNSDGSGSVKAEDGRTWTLNSDGSGDFKAPDGTSAHVNADGTGSMTNPDGSTAVLNKDGSATVNEAGGQPTTYTKDQLEANSSALAQKSDSIGK